MTTATKFGAWSAPQSNLEIEYSLVVLDEIRRCVSDGFQRLRGGMEVGGVLYGTHHQGKLRIEAIREIACEHAHGPSFQFSENDHEALEAQLVKDLDDPKLQSYAVLGWFVSHPRKDIALQAADVGIYDRYFAGAWQITLVIRPGRGGNMRAGFFVRDADGGLKTDRSYQDFNFPELPPGVIPAMLNRPTAIKPAERSASRTSIDRTQRPEIPTDDSAIESYETPGPQMVPPQTGQVPVNRAPPTAKDPRNFGEPPPEIYSNKGVGRSWLPTLGLVAAAALLGALASFAGLRAFSGSGTGAVAKKGTDSISLSVLDRAGQLQIQWNHASAGLAGAVKGTLEIDDTGNKQSIPLSQQDLAQNGFTYARKSGDVQVHLITTNSRGEQKQEASRFLGSAVAGETALATAPETSGADSASLAAARTENERQQARIQQLERTLVILRGRLGMEQDK